MIQPYLKWMGNKIKSLDFLESHIGTGKRFIEPFVGSGSVVMRVHGGFDECHVSDNAGEIIEVFKLLQDGRVEELITNVQSIWDNDRATFYAARVCFNDDPSDIDRASLFLYLNKHSYGALYRFNKFGAFNGSYRWFSKPDLQEDNLRDVARWVQEYPISFTHVDFELLAAGGGPGDVIYCDPPYFGGVVNYGRTDFGPEDHQRLIEACRESSANGAKVLISGHDNKATRDAYGAVTAIHTYSVNKAGWWGARSNTNECLFEI